MRRSKTRTNFSMCLAIRGTFSASTNLKKFWRHLMMSEKPFFLSRIQSIQVLPDSTLIFYFQGWWMTSIPGIQISDICCPVPREFSMFESFLGPSQEVKKEVKNKAKNAHFGICWTSLTLAKSIHHKNRQRDRTNATCANPAIKFCIHLYYSCPKLASY